MHFVYGLFWILGSCILGTFASAKDAKIRIISLDYNSIGNKAKEVVADLANMPDVAFVGFYNYTTPTKEFTELLEARGYKAHHVADNKFLFASAQPLEKLSTYGFIYKAADGTRVVIQGTSGDKEAIFKSEAFLSAVSQALYPDIPKYILIEPAKIHVSEKSYVKVIESSNVTLGSLQHKSYTVDLRGRTNRTQFISDYWWVIVLVILAILAIIIAVLVY